MVGWIGWIGSKIQMQKNGISIQTHTASGVRASADTTSAFRTSATRASADTTSAVRTSATTATTSTTTAHYVPAHEGRPLRDEEAQGERPREAALREQDPVRPGAAGCTPQEGAGERAAEAVEAMAGSGAKMLSFTLTTL